jgi:type VI secretion system ImpC/EvpB family protein
VQSAAHPNPAPDSTGETHHFGAVSASTLLDRLPASPVAETSLTLALPTPTPESPRPLPSHPAELILHLFGSSPRTTSDLLLVKQKLSGLIAEIDLCLSRQVNQILHEPRFQQLESSWRGLYYLWDIRRQLLSETGSSSESPGMLLRVLSVRKSELLRDFNGAAEFDQSQIFRKIYEEEFGMAGGLPYGLLISDLEFTNHPDDLDLLAALSGVAAASFAPLIASASPALLGLDDFRTLAQPLNLARIVRSDRYIRWRSLRQDPDTRFVGLTLPRVLLRKPWEDDGSSRFGFRFRESVESPDRSSLLWGSAAWAFAGVVCRSFAMSGWFADIRGVQRGADDGGLVTELPAWSFSTDVATTAERTPLEVRIPDAQESELCELGFIPLSACTGTPFTAFNANGSLHEPERFSGDELATANSRISAMLQYVLCCSRIAHYLKVRVRDNLGGLRSASELENSLQNWLQDYVTPDDRADAATKARFPLRNASVELAEEPGRPGSYQLKLLLQPHYQLDQLSSSISFVATRVNLGF